MSYTSYKPWVGKNYHLQDEKIMILFGNVVKPMSGICLSAHANVTENSLIAYVDDFINHRLKYEDKGLVFISEVLAMQKIEDINRSEIWSNYACYFPYVMDSADKTQHTEAHDWATQEFFHILQQLQPNKIIVSDRVLFEKLPTPDNTIQYEIQEENFELTFDNFLYNRKVRDTKSAINEYIVNQKSIYALKFLQLSLQRHAFGKLAFLGGRYKLERYFDDIRELEKRKIT